MFSFTKEIVGKSLFFRPLVMSSRVTKRLLSRAESKSALKPFYFAVHPDLFGQFPTQRAINEDSLKRLNSYIDNLEKKFPVYPTHLTFYLKNNDEGCHNSNVNRCPNNNDDTKFKTVRISLFSRDLYFTVSQVLKSCGMNEELNHSTDTLHNELPSPFGGPLDWLQVMRKYADKRSNLEQEFHKKAQVTLKNFLQDELEKAKQRLEQSEKSYEEAMAISRQVCGELGLRSLSLNCGWSCTSCQGSLKNLLHLPRKSDILILRGRSLVLTRWTGVDPRGNVMLGVEDVPQFWLSLFNTLEDYDVLVHQVLLWEKKLSEPLGNIKVTYDPTTPPSLEVLEYLNYLHRLVMGLRRSRFGKVGHPLLPGSFKNNRCQVASPNSSLSLSNDGTFVIPASTPSDVLLKFLLKNKEKSIAVKNEFIRNASKEQEMIEKCKATLKLKSLAKEEPVSASQMLSCLEALVRQPFEELHGTSLTVSKYYRVSEDGRITIPWDWE